MAARSGPQRRNLRLAGWDYRSPGPYGITLVTQNREWLFGEIVDHAMVLNDPGAMIGAVWQEMETEFPRIVLDSSIVMPNHLHAIVHLCRHNQVRNPTLGDVVQRFKSITTARYSTGVHRMGWPPYDRRLWQQEYYDHIIRDEADLMHARIYIAENPAKWQSDPDREVIVPPRLLIRPDGT